MHITGIMFSSTILLFYRTLYFKLLCLFCITLTKAEDICCCHVDDSWSQWVNSLKFLGKLEWGGGGGNQLGPLGTAATNGLLCQTRVIMMMKELVE
jgi:hypothetical protein